MRIADPKVVLWENVSKLMQHRYGRENLTRLAADCKFGPGTSTRLKQQGTSVGVETLQKLAEGFGLQPWHLLVPSLDPSNPPVLWMTATEERAYQNLRTAAIQLERVAESLAPYNLARGKAE